MNMLPINAEWKRRIKWADKQRKAGIKKQDAKSPKRSKKPPTEYEFGAQED